MGKLNIKRIKSFVGAAVKMDCRVDGEIICQLKNGEEAACDVESGIIEFRYGFSNNAQWMSEPVYLDMDGRDSVHINVKHTLTKPQVTVLDEDALADGPKPTFTPTRAVGEYFGINECSRHWAIGKGNNPSLRNGVPHSYNDIIGFELIEDGASEVQGDIGRAAAGALLFGGVGAVVGSVTGEPSARQVCTNMMVKITVNDISAPAEYIKLVTSTIDKNSSTYKTAFQNAQDIISILQLICSQREAVKSADIATAPTKKTSAADEIREFKALLDDGIITEEEFKAKKAQLLGL